MNRIYSKRSFSSLALKAKELSNPRIALQPTLPFFNSPYMHSTNNEDYLSELTILDYLHKNKINNDKLNLLSICGGGDTITSLLNYPEMINKIDCVDMNESQLWLTDLKIKSMITFKDRQNCLKLLLSQYHDGDNKNNNNQIGIDRINLYDLLRGSLKCKSRSFWDLRRTKDINYGIIGCSIYDRLLLLMQYGLNLSLNTKDDNYYINDITDLGKEIEYSLISNLDNEYLPILFNHKMRPRAFVNVERIAKNHKSLIENFYYKFGNEIFDNYFFTLIFNLDFGSNNNNNLPLWLQQNVYNQLRSKYKNSFHVDKILEFHIGDVSEIGFKIACKDNKYKYDYINLSNAMEWMDIDYYHHIINILSKVLNKNGIIYHRFHLIKDDEIMRKQIIFWNKAIKDSGLFDIIDNNDPLKIEAFKNERSKFGFHPDCLCIAVRK